MCRFHGVAQGAPPLRYALTQARSVPFLLISSVLGRRVLGMDSEPGYLRIATEEAFAPPELIALWRSMLDDGTCDDPGFLSLPGFYLRSKAERPAAILARLQDLGERRIADMDAAGIDRGTNELGFKGVIINSHTQGEYLDDPKFWPIFEAAQALDTPIYLHPNTPPRNMIGPMLEAGLDSAIYGFAVETGLHLMTAITAGVFDRFPRL